YNKPAETREAIDAEGWFHTGDIGELDADGYLKITDRKKDLLKTAGGKYIAPQPIENTVRLNKFVASAVVLGDQRKFPIILIVPNFENLERWAKERGLAYASQADLIRLADVKAKMEREVMGGLRDLAKFEMPKKVVLLERDFTIEPGELTPSLKVKRRQVAKHCKAHIDRVDAAHQPREPHRMTRSGAHEHDVTTGTAQVQQRLKRFGVGERGAGSGTGRCGGGSRSQLPASREPRDALHERIFPAAHRTPQQ